MQNSLNRNRMSRTSRISRIKHTTTPRHRILESEFLPWYGYQNLGHLVKSPKIGYYVIMKSHLNQLQRIIHLNQSSSTRDSMGKSRFPLLRLSASYLHIRIENFWHSSWFLGGGGMILRTVHEAKSRYM